MWNRTLDKYLTEYGFQKAGFEECSYILRDEAGQTQLIVVTYVDNCIIINPKETRDIQERFMKDFNRHFELTDEGELRMHLGVSHHLDRAKGLL